MNDVTKGSGNRPPQTGLRLDKNNGKVFGVCSGLANWSGVDAMIWRIGFVACTLLGIGFPILIYIAMALIID